MAPHGLAPHVVVDELLSEEAAADALSQISRLLPRFHAATVVGGKSPSRLSRILTDTADLAWVKHISAKALVVASACSDFRLFSGLEVLQVECTYTPDGGFYRPHRDETSVLLGPRQLTFIYYLHVQPRRFEGGDLLIYAGLDDGTMYSSNTFVRIQPTHNRLVIFPSYRVHEVKEVVAPSDSGLARFCVNGWIGRSVL